MRVSNQNQSIINDNLNLSPYFSTTKPGIINEEELYRLLISVQIEKKYGIAKANAFNRLVDSIKHESATIRNKIELEDVCRTALINFVENKQIGNSDASFFSTQAFSASQLDNNSEALYDGIGSTIDKTIAEAPIEKAIQYGLKILEGHTTNPARRKFVKIEKNLSGLLIKPKSNNEGTLAILIPRSFVTTTSTVLIKDLNGKIIEEGHLKSFGEDGTRVKFSFNADGASYPKGVTLEVVSNGQVTFKMDNIDLAKRFER